jgi:gas vesicle protein
MAENDGGSAAEKLTFLLIGAGIGATLALLFAPKSGRELRGDIADYTRRGVDYAGEGARAIGAKATDAYGSARERVSSGAGAISDIANRQKEQIARAIEAGKQAYREEKRKAGEAPGAIIEGEEA